MKYLGAMSDPKDLVNKGYVDNSIANIPTATTTGNGLMSSTDKTKLGNIADYITEQGTSSSWYYRKWNSGKVEAWTTYNAGSQTPSKWTDYMYYKDINVAIPSGIFSATPTNVQANNIGTDYQFSVFCAVPTSTTNIRVRAIKPNSGGATPILSIYANSMA